MEENRENLMEIKNFFLDIMQFTPYLEQSPLTLDF